MRSPNDANDGGWLFGWAQRSAGDRLDLGAHPPRSRGEQAHRPGWCTSANELDFIVIDLSIDLSI